MHDPQSEREEHEFEYRIDFLLHQFQIEISLKKMDFDQIGKRYLFAFYLLGQSSLNPYHKSISLSNSSIKFKIIHHLPSSMFFLLMTIECIQFMYDLITLEMDLAAAIRTVFIGGKLITSLFVIRCSTFFDETIPILWRNFLELEQFTIKKLQMHWHFCQFQHEFFFDIAIISILFIFRVLYKILIDPVSPFKKLKLISVYVMIGFSRVTILHVVAYLNLLKHSMIVINRNLSRSAGEQENRIFRLNQKSKYQQIEMLKKMHFKLWKVGNGINKIFGWIMMTVIVQTTNDVLQPTYYIVTLYFENVVPAKNSYRIVGKTRNFSIHFFIHFRPPFCCCFC